VPTAGRRQPPTSQDGSARPARANSDPLPMRLGRVCLGWRYHLPRPGRAARLPGGAVGSLWLGRSYRPGCARL